jgi:hypothetical protein
MQQSVRRLSRWTVVLAALFVVLAGATGSVAAHYGTDTPTATETATPSQTTRGGGGTGLAVGGTMAVVGGTLVYLLDRRRG